MITLGAEADQLVAVLRAPAQATALNAAQWSSLLATARACNLIGALADKLQTLAEVHSFPVPPSATRHLAGALQLAARQRLSVQWEAHCLQRALGGLGVPVVLLKGAAYVMAPGGLGRGRMFGDIDVLVPRDALGNVESALMLDGWVSAKTDAYDQHYYRQWMHEIPPMTHIRRGTVIDVHHTILPLTARNAPDPAQIIARATPVPGLPALRVPTPEDLLIHSVTHLVHEGELHNGLRDLHDIDSMLRGYDSEAAFWGRLVSNAAGNDLAGPVLLGLRLAHAVFDSPVPEAVLLTLTGAAAPRWRRSWLPEVYGQALRPPTRADAGASAAAARSLIYIRSHALRMPLPMLLRHLSIKAWKGLTHRDAEATTPPH
ncbi:MAG: nucleotidyltransferase family protein [Polaromonas sp.]|uniref:nucleotidyltransferase domain-containing protein n=1 Tax=Polaromonas sp. TaxID=1869339 RepID=UPI002720AA39|nr:nucleotidyltransferase family protein [Polaromonas sp.]MDO9112692.1 nucleotidyltransferase family protein [Polaromonas sp.]